LKDHKRAEISVKRKLGTTGEIWEVYTSDEREILGIVKLFIALRGQYLFEPEIHTFFNDKRMKAIGSFLTDLNFSHKSKIEHNRQGANV